MGVENEKVLAGAGATAIVLILVVFVAVITSKGGSEELALPTFSRRVSECIELDAQDSFNVTEFRKVCEIQGKRIIINPDKIPYNLSEVILWTLDNGNTIKTMQMEAEEGEECYIFDRLEKVLATEVIAKQRWKAVRLKQKFDRNRFQNFSGSYSDDSLFIAKGGHEKEIYVPEDGADTGLFAAVLQAYKNHWVLRTTPDDWFLPVIRRIAQVVDNNALKPEVENYLFGRGRSKKNLTVQFNRGFEEMFAELTKQVSDQLVLLEYATVFQANFSTTTDTDRLVSQLILLSSVQKYFNFDTYIACGIPEVELMGTEGDWMALIKKFKDIRKILNPISDSLDNITHYLDSIVLPVSKELLKTYQGTPSKDWWNNIVLKQSNEEQVCTKLRKVVERWDGWLVEYLNGEEGQQMRDIPSGLLTLPLQVENSLFDLSYPATLVAGQIGFSLFEEEVAVVKPYAGWAMLVTQEVEKKNKKIIWDTILHRKEERERIRQHRKTGWRN